jgi:hypothetical protein
LYADGNLGGDGRIQIAGHLDIQTHNGDDDVRFIVSSAQGSDGEIVVYGQTHVDLGNAGPEGDEFRAYSSDDGGYIDFYGQFHLHHHKGQSHVFADEYETFHDDASVNGGNGYDEIEFFATYFGDLDIRNFESIST